MRAEDAYLFRHALLRDAAYQLQMPGERAKLHALALDIIEVLFGGRAPAAPRLAPVGKAVFLAHPTDPYSEELAEHAGAAGMHEIERLYLLRSAQYLDAAFDLQGAAAAWRRLAGLVDDFEGGLALWRSGVSMHRMGRLDQAFALFEQSVDRSGLHGDARCKVVALQGVGVVCQELRQLEQAEHALGMAARIARESGERGLQANAQCNLALVLSNSGRHEEALALFKSGIEVFQELAMREDLGVAYGNLAVLYDRMERWDEALGALERALTLHREVGNRRHEGIALGDLILAYQIHNRMADAEAAGTEALAIDRETGNRRYEGIHGCALALLNVAMGRVDDARELWHEAIHVLKELGDELTIELWAGYMRQDCAKAGISPFDV